ncbi:MAG: hypothetical protein ACP5OG_02230 [Candidatus Nanoarchaeia archaeon]
MQTLITSIIFLVILGIILYFVFKNTKKITPDIYIVETKEKMVLNAYDDPNNTKDFMVLNPGVYEMKRVPCPSQLKRTMGKHNWWVLRNEKNKRDYGNFGHIFRELSDERHGKKVIFKKKE